MNVKECDWKKISKRDVKVILNSVTIKDITPNGELVSKLLIIINNNLRETTINYLTADQAVQQFGNESSSYIKPNGLPYIMDPIRKELDYMRGIIRIQLRMHEELLKGVIPPDINHLSQYVFYSFVAHSLSKLGWE